MKAEFYVDGRLQHKASVSSLDEALKIAECEFGIFPEYWVFVEGGGEREVWAFVNERDDIWELVLWKRGRQA